MRVRVDVWRCTLDVEGQALHPGPVWDPPCKGFERSGSRQRIMHAFSQPCGMQPWRNQPHFTSHHAPMEKLKFANMRVENKKARGGARCDIFPAYLFLYRETRATR